MFKRLRIAGRVTIVALIIWCSWGTIGSLASLWFSGNPPVDQPNPVTMRPSIDDRRDGIGSQLADGTWIFSDYPFRVHAFTDRQDKRKLEDVFITECVNTDLKSGTRLNDKQQSFIRQLQELPLVTTRILNDFQVVRAQLPSLHYTVVTRCDVDSQWLVGMSVSHASTDGWHTYQLQPQQRTSHSSLFPESAAVVATRTDLNGAPLFEVAIVDPDHLPKGVPIGPLSDTSSQGKEFLRIESGVNYKVVGSYSAGKVLAIAFVDGVAR